MDPNTLQIYIYDDYRVKALINEWKQLKSRFEAKAAKISKMSPTVKSMLILSLTQFMNRIKAAKLRMWHVLDYIFVVCTVYEHESIIYGLQHNPVLGSKLETTVDSVTSDIEVLLSKLKYIAHIPFKKLPYEFFLVALLPPDDLTKFKLAGKTANNYVEKRGMFACNLRVCRDNIDYKAAKKWHGPYTWKHVIHLMNASKNLQSVDLYNDMIIEAHEFDAFFAAFAESLHQHEHLFRIDLICFTLNAQLKHRCKEYVESRTNFKAFFPDDYVVIYKEPKL
uniref:FTH domain-containing protein n=1 Tax=Panagrellus redivivus TaxID=6233 RepID=A0A7E4UUE0_PANRE